MQDVVVVGAGLSGSLAAIMLHERGFRVTVVDRYAAYPAEFRAEQLVGNQIKVFRNIGLDDNLIDVAKIVPRARNFSFGKQLSSVLAPHYGMPYQDIVQALRRRIPNDVQFIVGRVSDIESGPASIVRLDDGQEITAKLVVMATGLNTKLSRKLGVAYEAVSVKHSTTIGFDIRSSKCNAADSSVLVYYGNSLHDGIDYLTIFPCKDILRGNLFLYRDPHDPWVRQLRQAPRETLLQAMPALANELGEFTVEQLQCRTSDVAVASQHQRDGIVYIGDAFQTPCPAAGTGISRLLVDVERLTVHATRWLAANDTSAASLQSYYNDPVKRRSDRAAINEARFRRAISTNASLFWAVRRQAVDVKRFIKYALHTLADMVARSGRPMKQRLAGEHGTPGKLWMAPHRPVDPMGIASMPARPDGTS